MPISKKSQAFDFLSPPVLDAQFQGRKKLSSSQGCGSYWDLPHCLRYSIMQRMLFQGMVLFALKVQPSFWSLCAADALWDCSDGFGVEIRAGGMLSVLGHIASRLHCKREALKTTWEWGAAIYSGYPASGFGDFLLLDKLKDGPGMITERATETFESSEISPLYSVSSSADLCKGWSYSPLKFFMPYQVRRMHNKDHYKRKPDFQGPWWAVIIES